MKKHLLAAALVMGMVSAVQAEERNISGQSYGSEREACDDAKAKAKAEAKQSHKVVAEFDKCACSSPGSSSGAKRIFWECSVDYKVKKED